MQWYALREDLAEAIENGAGEEPVKVIAAHIEPTQLFADIAEYLVVNGWVQGWPDEEEDE